MTQEQLKNHSPWVKGPTLASVRPSEDPTLDGRVLRAAQEEVGLGWLEPTAAEELDSSFGSAWSPSRRFGVVQGDKLRCVDDYSPVAYYTSDAVDDLMRV